VQSKKRSCAYTRAQLLPVILPLVGADFTVTPKVLTKTLEAYLNIPPSPSLVKRLKDDAIMACMGDGDVEVQRLPGLVKALKELGHKAELYYANSKEMVQILVDSEERKHKYQQEKLDKHQRTKFDTTKATQVAQAKVTPGSQYVTGWSWAPATSLKTMPYFVPVDFGDACHVKERRNGGTLTTTCAMDANHHLVTMGYTWTIENECFQTWKKHCDFLLKSYKAEAYDTVDRRSIIDGVKGGIAAIKSILRKGLYFACSEHRFKTFISDSGVWLCVCMCVCMCVCLCLWRART
jgi:hypothetical protein